MAPARRRSRPRPVGVACFAAGKTCAEMGRSGRWLSSESRSTSQWSWSLSALPLLRLKSSSARACATREVPLGAGCRPQAGSAPLHHASPFIEARAKGRGRRSSVARSRLRPVGAKRGVGPTSRLRSDPSEQRPAISESCFSNASELDASRCWHRLLAGRGYPREVRELSPRCRGEHVLFASPREWVMETFGTKYLASFDTPASPLHGPEWCQKGFSLHLQGIMILTIYLQIARK